MNFMVKFVNANFDLDKKVSFSYGRMVFLLATSFSIGILFGMALFFVKNQDFLASQPQNLPALKPAATVNNIVENIRTIPIEIIKEIADSNSSCQNNKNITAEDYSMDLQTTDLNDDKVEEIIIDAYSICGLSLFGATSDNHPVYIFQKINGVWTKILESSGSGVDISEAKTDGYNDISVSAILNNVLITSMMTSYGWNKSRLSYEEVSSITQSQNDTEGKDSGIGNWNSYSNYKYGFALKYPSSIFQSSFDQNTLNLFSTPFNCEDQSGKIVEVNDFKITFKPRSGLNYDQIWKDSFEFDFNENSYDGLKKIDGKLAYYFFQGAEMEMPRTAYLVKKTFTTALEINTYVLEHGMVTNCIPPIENNVNQLSDLDQKILSTFKFLN